MLGTKTGIFRIRRLATPGAAPRRKRWTILASFFDESGTGWIDAHCGRDDLEFERLVPQKRQEEWHRRGPTTPLREWVDLFLYSLRAVWGAPDGIVTNFPPLALGTAFWLKLLRRRRVKLVAWTFNIGSTSNVWKGRLAGRLLDRVDCFVVHSTHEIDEYSAWLGIDRSRFRFVPLQRAPVAPAHVSPIRGRYIVAMGSANRDYETLVRAVAGTGIKTVIVGKQSQLDSLPDCDEVIKMHSLTNEQCFDLLASAYVNVVPLKDWLSASGQVTFLTAFQMGIPTIATRCIGTVDYFEDGRTGLLVEAGDASALRVAIQSLCQDERRRRAISRSAHLRAQVSFSDDAAGKNLAAVIDAVAA